MRFSEFLRTTVLLSAGAASLLAAVTVIGAASGRGNDLVEPVAAGWWVVAALIGLWLGRRAETSPPIASVLAAARSRHSLPETNPARTVLNRLWPLLVSCLGATAIGVALPQVPAIAAGFAIIWALAWRRQSSAVIAIEDRDGARFFIEHTSPLRPIRLVRTPGFRSLPADRADPGDLRDPVRGAVSPNGGQRLSVRAERRATPQRACTASVADWMKP